MDKGTLAGDSAEEYNPFNAGSNSITTLNRSTEVDHSNDGSVPSASAYPRCRSDGSATNRTCRHSPARGKDGRGGCQSPDATPGGWNIRGSRKNILVRPFGPRRRMALPFRGLRPLKGIPGSP